MCQAYVNDCGLLTHIYLCCRYTWQGTWNLRSTVETLQTHAVEPEPCAASETQQQSRTNTGSERKEKSLGLLAQKFVQMLLCAPSHSAIALEDAAKSLLGMPLKMLTVCGAWQACL